MASTLCANVRALVQLSASPLLRRGRGREAGLLADDAAKQALEIAGRSVVTHGWVAPFALADERPDFGTRRPGT